jgi:hypothetical protein
MHNSVVFLSLSVNIYMHICNSKNMCISAKVRIDIILLQSNDLIYYYYFIVDIIEIRVITI